MPDEKTSSELRLKIIKNYLIEVIKGNDLMSKKQKNLHGFKLHRALTYFSFFGHWLGFNFFSSFISWHAYRYGEFCSWIKYFCNNCRN